jgi:outer membrane protein insertion porin family
LALALSMAVGALAQDVGSIREIEIRGATNINKDTILSVMRTKVGQPYVQAQLDSDKKAIDDMGFFQAVDVRAREVGGGNWQVIVELIEYPRIKEIRIVGNSAIKSDDIRKILADGGLGVGNVYNLKSKPSVSSAIRKLYSDRGYFVQVDPFGLLPESPETLSVTVIELKVNSVSVQGATRTKKYVLDRMIKTRPNDVLYIPKWRDDLRRLYSTQWFEKVESIENLSQEDPGRVDLIADVKESRTGIFNVGLQIDPRNSVAGMVRLTDTNFKGTGQTVGVGLLQGSRGGGASVDLDYGNPFIDRHDTALNASLYSKVLYRFAGVGFGGEGTPTEDDQFTERRTGFNVSVSRPFRREYFASVGLRLEEIKTADLDVDKTTGFIQQDGRLGMLAFGLSRDRRDVVVDPARGDYVRLNLEPGFSDISKVGGDTPDTSILGMNTFVRTNLEYRTYWSPQAPRGLKIDEPRRVLALRARYGRIDGEVPFFEQFFVGGSDSLRGYVEDRFWGKEMATLSAEWRQPIQKSFNAVLFADYGAAWGGYGSVNDYTQSNRAQFKLGYGIGFSFRTPLGPIRLDFGFDNRGKSRTHFIIGTSF